MQPHRWQPTRLPRPWDYPGKNTGVCCHFLLQCMKVKGESEVAQTCPTLSYPMDCSLTVSSVHGIFQARVLEWGAIAFSREMTYIPPNLCIILLKFSRKYILENWCFSSQSLQIGVHRGKQLICILWKKESESHSVMFDSLRPVNYTVHGIL